MKFEDICPLFIGVSPRCNCMNKFSQKTAIGIMTLMVGCNSLPSETITVFRDSSVPRTEYWQIESVPSSDRFTLKKRFSKRTFQLCGIEPIPEAKSYLQERVKQSPETVPVIFAGKDRQSIWYGDIWFKIGEGEESAAGLLLLNRLAKLSKDYYNCPNSDSLKLAEDLGKEQKSN